MTNKFQWSVRRGEDILVLSGDTFSELEKNIKDAGMEKYYEGYMKTFRQEFTQPQNGTPAQHQPAQSNGNGETESIEVESIEFVGKNRWVVRGGWATKYGITCWPEVLEKAGILEHLKMDELNEPKGDWIAIYSKKPKQDGDGMTADKVIKLAKREQEEDFPFP